MMAEAGAAAYHPLPSLATAQVDRQGIVVFKGYDGGQIYVVCPAHDIFCAESRLQQLLVDLDETEWPENDDPSMRRIYFEIRAAGEGVPGGTGSGQVTGGLWVHPGLCSKGLLGPIRDVLSGNRERIK